jgi:hypothetical protein
VNSRRESDAELETLAKELAYRATDKTEIRKQFSDLIAAIARP